MGISLAIALNAILVVGLLGLLAWVMHRPTRLIPHISARHPGHRLSVVQTEAHEAELMREAQPERIAA